MALALLRFALRPSAIKQIFQTLRYPSQVGAELPPAEVLSIAVSEGARGKGIGRALVAAALAQLSARGIQQAKVAVSADNAVANRFYRRCGFELVLRRDHHGLPMNVYVAPVRR